MRYRIVLEIDTRAKRVNVNVLAARIGDLAVTRWCNPVYLTTEVVKNEQREILKAAASGASRTGPHGHHKMWDHFATMDQTYQRGPIDRAGDDGQ